MAKDTRVDSSHEYEAWDDDERDDLEELIAEIAKKNPEFPAMVEAAYQRRQEARARGEDPNEEPLAEEEADEQPATRSAKP